MCRHLQRDGEQPAGVGTAVKSLTDDFARTWRPHCEHSDSRSGVQLFQSEGLFQCVQIFRIENGRQSGAVDSPFGCHGIFAHVSCVWYLLGKYYDF